MKPNINKISEKIIQLINKELTEKESSKLIKQIKADPELKMEFTIISQQIKQANQKMRNKIKKRIKTVVSAPDILENIYNLAAFSPPRTVLPEDLPISDDTIDEFLEDE